MQVKISELRSMPFDQVEKHFGDLQQACAKAEEEKAEGIRERTFLRQQNQVMTEVETLSTRIVSLTRQTPMEPTRRQMIIRSVVDMTRTLQQLIFTIRQAIKNGAKQACEAMYDAAVKICNFIYDHGMEIYCGAATVAMALVTVASVGFMAFALLTGNFTVGAVNPFDSITIPS